MSETSTYSFSSGYQDRILSCILRDLGFLKQYRDAVSSAFFERADHQTITDLVLVFFDKYKEKPGRDVLVEELTQHAKRLEWDAEDTQKHVVEIDRLISIESTDAEQESIRDNAATFGQNQAVKNAVLESVELIRKNEEAPGSIELEGMVPILQNALMVGTANNTGINVVQYLTDVSKIAELDGISDPRFRIPTGFRKLDSFIDGGLGAGEIGFIIAESGKGKSMALLNFGANALMENKKVIYFTLELKPYQIGCRLGSWLTRLDQELVKKGDPEYVRKMGNLDTAWASQIRTGVTERKFQPIYFQPSSATVLNLRSAVERIHAKDGWKPDLIIVDYIDELRGLSGKQNDESTYHMYGELTTDLIDLSATYTCPVWTASQIQREAYVSKKDQDIEPGLSNVGQSMKKVDKADIVVAIIQTEDEEARGRLRFKVLKNRIGSGKNQYVNCNVNFGTARITELASAQNPDPQGEPPGEES